MGDRLNCWEHMGCGRQPGGERCEDLGVCPAAAELSHNGVNRGDLAGRVCWAIVGTICDGELRGTMGSNLDNCMKCDFFHAVAGEEADFVLKPY